MTTKNPLILSNVNPLRLEQIKDLVEKIDKESPFLDPAQDLILVERRPTCLEEISEFLFQHFMPERTEIPSYFSPVEMFKNLGEGEAVLAYRRTKTCFSLTEKITRFYGKEREMADLISPLRRDLLFIRDIYGLSFVSRDKKGCYSLQEKVNNFPGLELAGSEDFIEQPKESGYRAIHNTYFWKGEPREYQDLLIKIHFEALEDHLRNREESKDSRRNHYIYTNRKILLPHQQGEFQIVIIESPEIIKLELGIIKPESEIIKPELVLTDFAKYHLIQ